jgi:hypothetical protein
MPASAMVLYTLRCIAEIRTLKDPRVVAPAGSTFCEALASQFAGAGRPALYPFPITAHRQSLSKATGRWCA